MGVVHVAIAVIEWDQRYLVGQRGADAALPGFHEFPGGKVQPAETAVEAAVRECREETGIEISLDRLLDEVEQAYAHADLRLSFFAGHPVQVPPPPPEGSFRWMTRTELSRAHFPDANRTVIARLLATK